METTDQAVHRVRRYFDENVETEWLRLEESIAGRVSYEIHRRFLVNYVREGMRVLEIGAGPGRFTKELVRLGLRVTVSDLSSAQLEANQIVALELGYGDSIEEWLELDVRDTSAIPTSSYDAVVAFGGPLSYVFDDAESALRGLLRIAKPEGVVLASVMSLLGAWRHFLPAVLELPDEANNHILATGDLRSSQPDGHVCQLYRSTDLVELVSDAGAQLLHISASNWASLDHPDELATLESDPPRWENFINNEVAVCSAPGALDGGTHLLFACRSSA